MYVPTKASWRLNERHYGALQGLDKQQTVDKYGIDQVNIWRRSYDVPPPDCTPDSEHYPGNDRKYAALADATNIRAESLKVRLRSHLIRHIHLTYPLYILYNVNYYVNYYTISCTTSTQNI